MIGARKQGAAVRAFFALALDDACRRACGELARRLQAAPGGDGVRWVRPESYHLTLRFLGNVATEQVPDLVRRVGDEIAGLPAFTWQPAALLAFPSPRRPRVVALAVEPEVALAALAERVERAVVRAGLAEEKRLFRAHLTLGRVRNRRIPELAGVPVPAVANPAREVVLYRSDLDRSGARYVPLHTLPLEGENRPRAASSSP